MLIEPKWYGVMLVHKLAKWTKFYLCCRVNRPISINPDCALVNWEKIGEKIELELITFQKFHSMGSASNLFHEISYKCWGRRISPKHYNDQKCENNRILADVLFTYQRLQKIIIQSDRSTIITMISNITFLKRILDRMISSSLILCFWAKFG